MVQKRLNRLAVALEIDLQTSVTDNGKIFLLLFLNHPMCHTIGCTKAI